MTSPSAIINRALRSHVAPALREAGFDHVGPRDAWAWRDEAIWVFNIRAVGKHFSDVTGWPPSSLTAWLGVFFTFMPDPPLDALKKDTRERFLPAEHFARLENAERTRIGQVVESSDTH